MSFSADVKKELSAVLPESDHCARSELAAFVCPERVLTDPYLTDRLCCKKAFIRGMFLAAGSVSDPEKEYQLEISCRTPLLADFLASMLISFSIFAKTVERKSCYVVYLKGGDQIADFLALMQASKSLLSMENVRVVKDFRNHVNRQVNCETANLGKTISASIKQTKEIEFIRDHSGFERLPESLRKIAEARVANPDASLVELGLMMDPPLGKSAVNHRLRRLKEIAEEEGYDS